MITQQRFRVNAVNRLLCEPAAAAPRSLSASLCLVPARLDCQQRQQQLQHRRPSSTQPPPQPQPQPRPLAISRRCSPLAVAVRTIIIRKHEPSCSPREDVRLSKRRQRFSLLIRPLSTDTRQKGVQQHTETEKDDGKRGSRQRVVVGMSGGVDSSVVAMLLKKQVSGQLVEAQTSGGHLG